MPDATPVTGQIGPAEAGARLLAAQCLLVVAPHPDDEVLGCAYLMRHVAASGGRIVVAWLTDGGASHGDRGDALRAELVATRQREALAGLAAIGVEAATCFLDNPDGGLGDPGRRAAAAAILAELCAQHRVDTVCVTSDTDAHPDHRAAFAIASRLPVAERYAYLVSARYDGDEVELPPTAIVVTGPGALKRAALECHASQFASGGSQFPLTAAAVDRFCAAPEIFVPVAPD